MNKKIKIATINIWRYYEWEVRKPRIISFLKREKPDIVLLQECCDDEKFKDFGENQAIELNKELNYKTCVYHPVIKLEKWFKEPLNRISHMGLGTLSNFSLIESKLDLLKIYPENGDKKQEAAQRVKLKFNNNSIDIINVHFANNDKSSKLQLREVIKNARNKNIYPIIGGDFNMIISQDVIDEADKDFDISYKIKKYISFPPTNFSNNKEPVTLDYIISHKEKFKMEKVTCFEDEEISDHKPLIVEISVIN